MMPLEDMTANAEPAVERAAMKAVEKRILESIAVVVCGHRG